MPSENNSPPTNAAAAWIARALFALTLLFLVIQLILLWLNRQTVVPASWGIPAGPRGNPLSLLQDLLLVVISVIAGWMGLQLAARQPKNPMTWLLLLFGMTTALGVGMISSLTVYTNFTLELDTPLADWSAWVMNWIWVLPYALLFLLLALFPDGRPLSRRWRWLLGASTLCAGGMILSGFFQPVMESAFNLPNPLPTGRLPAALFDGLFWTAILGFLLSTLGLTLQINARYQASSGETRQQMKWLVASVAASAFLIVVGIVGEVLGGFFTSQLAVNFGMMFPILGIGIGVLRYRLWDIDLIIRRTVVYAILTALLGLTFFGGVALLQGGFRQLTGQESPLAVVLSTLAIAALFNPLRARVQNAVDRRFYRSRLDSRLALERFQEQLRSEVDLQAVQHGILQVVQDALEPEQVSLWLRPGRQAVPDD